MESVVTRPERQRFTPHAQRPYRPGHTCPQGSADHGLSLRVLRRENARHRGTGGVSAENRSLGFRPAFLDTRTERIYLSRFADGSPAPCHLLDGLPEEVVAARDGSGRVTATAPTLVSGFVLDGRFYDRDAAARALAAQEA